MIGKAMRFATVCTLAFAICGKASRDKVAAVSEGNTEDLEPSKISSFSRARRLAVILTAITSADALEGRPFQKDSNTAFAPILTNNLLDGTHDMLRPANANRANFAPNLATPQVFPHDIKLYATRRGEEAQAQNKILKYSSVSALKSLDYPTPDDRLAFDRLNKHKDCRLSHPPMGYTSTTWRNPPQFNVLEEYSSQAEGIKVSEGFDLFPEEKAALWSYANTDKYLINHIARGADKVVFEDAHYDYDFKIDITCTLTKEDMLPWLKFLNSGLQKMPRASPVRLYRGVGFIAKGPPGRIAPITGFSSFSEDFNVANCFAEQKRKSYIQPTIFVMDEHSSGRQLDKTFVNEFKEHKEVVFPVGTKFVIVEDEKVTREVVALWRKQLVLGTSYDGVQTIQGNGTRQTLGESLGLGSSRLFQALTRGTLAKPKFKVLVVKEVPSVSAMEYRKQNGLPSVPKEVPWSARWSTVDVPTEAYDRIVGERKGYSDTTVDI